MPVSDMCPQQYIEWIKVDDDGLVCGYTPSYLEPELSWFDPKPIDYYNGGSFAQEFVAEEFSS